MTSSALTAAKAAATATAADLEAVAHKLEVATAAHAETSAELSTVLAKDAAGEAVAVAHDVAVLRSELELRASRVAALKTNLASATAADFINVTSRFEAVGQTAAALVKEELLAPARAARIAKELADSERDAKYKADLRDMQARNTTRVDMSAL